MRALRIIPLIIANILFLSCGPDSGSGPNSDIEQIEQLRSPGPRVPTPDANETTENNPVSENYAYIVNSIEQDSVLFYSDQPNRGIVLFAGKCFQLPIDKFKTLNKILINDARYSVLCSNTSSLACDTSSLHYSIVHSVNTEGDNLYEIKAVDPSEINISDCAPSFL